jgi:hypothetical protein
MDFCQIRQRETKTGVEISPNFIIRRSTDLMVRGGSFYAVWDEVAGLWSTNEFDVQRLVDEELYKQAEKLENAVHVRAMSDWSSQAWRQYRTFVREMPNSNTQLDNTLTFADTPPKKGDYSSKRLPYHIKEGSTSSYDKLMGTLYAPEQREKLEWAIGSIIAGDSRFLQKFFVLYGEAGTGKSTFLNILEQLFTGYTAVFDAKALTTTMNAFATAAFKDNPLVAVQHDSDLSQIKDNSQLNSIVSHEIIKVNEKYRSAFPVRVNALLFLGTNQSVKISDAKSGLIRRLIDVHPTGDLLNVYEYEAAVSQIPFELGAIAHHCFELYKIRGSKYYARYKPTDMIIRTDMFYNFIIAHEDALILEHEVTLKQAWALYKAFCDEGGYDWRLNKSKFRDELRNYYHQYQERGRVDGVQVWHLYSQFKLEKLQQFTPEEEPPPSLVLEHDVSRFDKEFGDAKAQYASQEGTPQKKWVNVKTMLSEIETTKLHYVKPGPNLIVIDFDLRNGEGDKDPALNLAAASLWPPTYAEYSQGGAGIHLHYFYSGDVSELSHAYSPGIEVKTFPDDASLRRRLSKCNDIPIATISTGLPTKEKRVLDEQTMKSERALRELIMRNLRKEIHPGTKSSIDFIWKILEDAWNSGMQYDVTDLRGRVLAFANNSTNHSVYCVGLVQSMQFASSTAVKNPAGHFSDERLVFYDVEVFPNLFVVCWKYQGDANVVKMINPTGKQIEELCKYRLVGFNNRRFDNHILYARIMGYNEYDLYKLSQRIIAGEKSGLFGDAYNLSYADVWEFSSKRQSLKRFQIELGLNHKELGFPWDQSVSEDLWEMVVDYCGNDVITTEAVFENRKQDFVARQILATLSGLLINDTTQRHAAQIIFGNVKRPQEDFVYTDLSSTFLGYRYEAGKSIYHDEEVGEGGYVYAEPGMYSRVAVLDVASMHPTSIELLDLFGPYTKSFSDLKKARIAIKRRDYNSAKRMLGGKLEPYLGSDDDAKALADALKLVINIVYGLTSASFDNPFRDPRNKDNIVAKRGALFMIDLKKKVQDKGFQVIHIKTDSIKIPEATQEIIDYVIETGKEYGYDFEHETTYEKMCLVNDAVYIAKGLDGRWTAVGAQFQHPYVFKTLFSGEEIQFDDLCETKTVTTALYLDFGQAEPHFVGRAGLFVPVLEGTGGGTLLRGKEDKFHAVTGTKGYYWREAAIVRELGLEESVDFGYFRKLVDQALKSISNYGDSEQFRS